MSVSGHESPREAARAFTPQLTAFVETPLFDTVWADPALSGRDRSLITVAALVAMGRGNELGAHLRRALDNGLSKAELSAAITHLAFYAGFPAAIDASAIAAQTLGPIHDAERPTQTPNQKGIRNE
jgi:4-carboxymuconolactone decarboxylase